MKDYLVVMDVWQGNPQLNAQYLIDNGVSGLIIRLNSMGGGLHMDELFEQNYTIAKKMPAHCIYFVGNFGWVSGTVNYQWYRDHKPVDMDCYSFPDIETTMPGYAPASFSYDVEKFMGYLNYQPPIYTAEWCLPYGSTWRKGPYWWAQYLYSMDKFPAKSWKELYSQIADLPDKPTNSNKCPGDVVLWQICDNFVIDGHATDISVFKGTIEQLKTLMGNTGTSSIDPQPVKKYQTLHDMRVHPEPDETSPKLTVIPKGTVLDIVEYGQTWVKVKTDVIGYVANCYNGINYLKEV